VTLLILVLATVALYAITSFLFRSLETRRAELARQYEQRGKAALSQGHAEQAIAALRVAQSYEPTARSCRLLLAEALTQANHTDEATNYFLSLRESEPADGFINLELARLARQKKETQQAIDYYRAASLGNWQSNGVALRRQVQLELADYLIQNGQLAAARAEILIAAANAPEDAELDTLFGDKLLKANDPTDATAYYQKAVKLDQHNFPALFHAGRLAYSMGDYATAAQLLGLASKERPKAASASDTAQLTSLLNDTQQIQKLTLSANLPAQVRADHIREGASIAKIRFDSCAAHFNNVGSAATLALPTELDALKARWQSAATLLERRSSLAAAANQDNLAQLIFDTEIQTAQLCGPPSGDDALLLLLAKGSH
jgi:predicted Zn-dependent protease